MKRSVIGLLLFLAVISKANAIQKETNYQHGLSLFNSNEYESAIVYLIKAIRKNKKNANAYFLLGQSYHFVHRDDAAIQTYLKYLEIDPSNKNVTILLNELLNKKQNPYGVAVADDSPRAVEFELSYGLSSTLNPWGSFANNGGQNITGWVGYRFDPDVTLGIRFNYSFYEISPAQYAQTYLPANSRTYSSYSFSPDGTAESTTLQLIPTFKYTFHVFEPNHWEPFLMLGLGVVNEYLSTSNGQGTNYVSLNASSGSGTVYLGQVQASSYYFVGDIGGGLSFQFIKDWLILADIHQTFTLYSSQPSIGFYTVDLGLMYRL